MFGGLLLVALVMGKAGITDGLAYLLLAARVLQSSVHLASVSSTAVSARFFLFVVQLAIGIYWALELLMALVRG